MMNKTGEKTGVVNRVRAFAAKTQAKCMMKLAKVRDEREKWEPGDHLLEVLGTIIIAVVILILFRGAIINIFTNALNRTQENVLNLFDNAY